MDIRQLEYFLAVCERGSINKAAACLYTTQPNVSKVIASFEAELGRELFKRSHRGMQLTPYGNTIRQYAESVLKHIKLIMDAAGPAACNKFSVATYRSDVVAKLLVDFYKEHKNKIVLEYHQGSLEEITNNVQQGICEIGIVYVAQKQMQMFLHILKHKNLKFKAIAARPLCVYAGARHPLYNAASIDMEELKSLNVIRGVKEFFSLEHHLERINVGYAEAEGLDSSFYTNSEAAILNFLNNTDLCLIGIGSKYKKYEQYGIKAIPVNGSDDMLIVGVIYAEGQVLSSYAENFIEKYSTTL